MSDLILMHGENGKTFFVDKDEYLAHWKWGTKYVDKYQNKHGNWVYVYDNPNNGSGGLKNQYKDTKGVDDSRISLAPIPNKIVTKVPSNGTGKVSFRSTAWIDPRDNNNSTRDLGDNRYLDFDYINLKTGKKMSKARVNAIAAVNKVKNKAIEAAVNISNNFLENRKNKKGFDFAKKVATNFLKKYENTQLSAIDVAFEQANEFMEVVFGTPDPIEVVETVIEEVQENIKTEWENSNFNSLEDIVTNPVENSTNPDAWVSDEYLNELFYNSLHNNW